MKYPYGYSTASLPAFLVFPNTQRVFAALPKRGDVVVFRWPGDRSQIWVKRVIGLPGDRIGVSRGQVRIDGNPVAIEPAGAGEMETEDGSTVAAARFIETLPGGYEHPIFKMTAHGEFDDMPDVVVPPAISLSWATIATIPPTAACRSALAVSDCCRSRIWLAASTRSLVHGISPSKAGQFRIGRRAFGCRAFSRLCTECIFAAHDLFRKPLPTFRDRAQLAHDT